MPKKSALELKAAETIRFLAKEGLITQEHSLTIALIKELCAEWQLATSSTQRATLAKEIRSALDMLPKPEAKATDELADFLTELEA